MKINVKILLLTFILPLIVPPVLAESEEDELEKQVALGELEATRKVREMIKSIVEVEPENFSRQVRGLRNEVDRFFEHKKRVCNGEFSTVILNPSEVVGDSFSGEMIIRKLNPDERRICFTEMKEMQTQYINNIYKARTSYLTHLHEKRLEELNQARKEALKELSESL